MLIPQGVTQLKSSKEKNNWSSTHDYLYETLLHYVSLRPTSLIVESLRLKQVHILLENGLSAALSFLWKGRSRGGNTFKFLQKDFISYSVKKANRWSFSSDGNSQN